jgi:hypothetical protein
MPRAMPRARAQHPLLPSRACKPSTRHPTWYHRPDFARLAWPGFSRDPILVTFFVVQADAFFADVDIMKDD